MGVSAGAGAAGLEDPVEHPGASESKAVTRILFMVSPYLEPAWLPASAWCGLAGALAAAPPNPTSSRNLPIIVVSSVA